jgi:hypothetical protein
VLTRAPPRSRARREERLTTAAAATCECDNLRGGVGAGGGDICLPGWGCGGRRERQSAMAASARPGERATSFAVACSLLSRFVRQNGVAAADLGLRIKGERRNPAAALSRPGSFCSVVGGFRNPGGGGVQFRFQWGACCAGVRSGRGLCYPV